MTNQADTALIIDDALTEGARLQQQLDYDRFFNLSLDLLAVADFEGYFLRVNAAWEDTLGFTAAEIMAQPYLDLIHPDDRAATLAAAQGLSEGTVAIQFENRYRTKDGSYRWLLWSARPNDEQNLVYAVAHDITARKQAEQQLRESEERLKAGIAVAGVGLARFDYATNQVELSPEAAALYGFTRDELVVSRAQIHATFHPDERAELEAVIAQVIDPQGAGWFAQDHRVVWPNGEVRCLSVRKQVFFEHSGVVVQPQYAILAAIDVTERQQVQAELEARNRELDSFVHIVSHDLKAPLRGISNLSQWIEDDLEGTLLSETQSQMALLRTRVNRMATTIDGLLEYARIGRTNATINFVSVAELLAEAIDSLAPPPTFTIVISPHLPTLKTNRLLLFQVFANLISNSIQHHNRSDGKIDISCQECGDSYRFVVADDGPGIAPQYHDNIFTIFQSVNPQNSPDSTGIGLSIVKKIVETTGGKIQLESAIGKGAKFCFTWPKQS